MFDFTRDIGFWVSLFDNKDGIYIKSSFRHFHGLSNVLYIHSQLVVDVMSTVLLSVTPWKPALLNSTIAVLFNSDSS